MESKTLESTEAQASGGAVAAPEESSAASCCVLETVVREGRVETVCVATCCDASADV